jgi:signal transduction histidine kinase
MRERVESLGGKMAVRVDAGFTIEAWLPLARAKAV